MSAAFSITGLTLTVAGAFVLSIRDLRTKPPKRLYTWGDAKAGFPRRESWIGFPLIAFGSLLQIVGVAVG